MIDFIRPAVLLMLPLPWLVWHLAPATGLLTGLPIPGRLLELMAGGTRAVSRLQRRMKVRRWLAGTGWTALVFALAVPVTSHGPLLQSSGRDLVLAVDASASMTERDALLDGMTVQRFGALKEVASAFIRKRAGDRIGLIAFAEQTYLIAPLTYDVDAAVAFLNEIVVGLPGRKTAIGDAIGLATKTLRDQPNAARVLILLSDGDSNAGQTAPVQAAQLARDNSVRVHAIGFGSAFANTAQGEQSNAHGLQLIADMTGGQFFVARTAQDLRQVYRDLDKLEPTTSDRPGVFAERDWVRELLILAALTLLALTWLDRRDHRV